MRAIGTGFLDFTIEYVNPLLYAYRVSGLSVRCVQEFNKKRNSLMNVQAVLFCIFVVSNKKYSVKK